MKIVIHALVGEKYKYHSFPKGYSFALCCSEYQGAPWIEHFHCSDDGGHVFPVTREDLRGIRKEIDRILGASS